VSCIFLKTPTLVDVDVGQHNVIEHLESAKDLGIGLQKKLIRNVNYDLILDKRICFGDLRKSPCWDKGIINWYPPGSNLRGDSDRSMAI